MQVSEYTWYFIDSNDKFPYAMSLAQIHSKLTGKYHFVHHELLLI